MSSIAPPGTGPTPGEEPAGDTSPTGIGRPLHGTGVGARALSIIPVLGLPEIRPGDRLGSLLAAQFTLVDGDVVVVTQKVVSKAEGRLVRIDPTDEVAKIALVESEARRVLRRRGHLRLTETRHGFICANAGVDFSNVPDGWAALLPLDPDRSARRIRDEIRARAGVEVAVVISDTFGRVWRRGVTDVAIGVAGIGAVLDLRESLDALGRPLRVTEVCVADEIAGAAELAMGKASGAAAAVVRGLDAAWFRPSSVAAEVVRPPKDDLFR